MTRFIIPALALVLLSGCTTPSVDREMTNFDAEKFSRDLEFCRGGRAFKVALDGFTGAVYGSAVGAAHGAYYGAVAGDAKEGTFIGAIAGSVIGVFMGAYEPFFQKEQNVRHCLSARGYSLKS